MAEGIKVDGSVALIFILPDLNRLTLKLLRIKHNNRMKKVRRMGIMLPNLPTFQSSTFQP